MMLSTLKSSHKRQIKKVGGFMVNSPHKQDADKIIGFFSNAREVYESSDCESLISFCLQVFGIKQYDIRELDSACDDLKTIIMLISREMNSKEGQDFNTIATGYINKYYKWIVATYNGQISDDDGTILFSSDPILNLEMCSNSKILSADYFTVVSEHRGFPDKLFFTTELYKEESAELGCDIIVSNSHGNGTMLIERTVPWTDCRRLWVGNKRMLMMRLNGKYRKVKDKRLREILSAAYEKYDDDLLFKTIYIEPGSLDKKDSFVLDFNATEDNCLFAIRKK